MAIEAAGYFVINVLLSGGTAFAIIKIIIKSESREALKDDIKALKADIQLVHTRIDRVNQNAMTKELCNLKHEPIKDMKLKIDEIYDFLLKKGVK